MSIFPFLANWRGLAVVGSLTEEAEEVSNNEECSRSRSVIAVGYVWGKASSRGGCPASKASSGGSDLSAGAGPLLCLGVGFLFHETLFQEESEAGFSELVRRALDNLRPAGGGSTAAHGLLPPL